MAGKELSWAFICGLGLWKRVIALVGNFQEEGTTWHTPNTIVGEW